MKADLHRIPRVSGFVVGHRESLHLGEGWWAREEDPNRPTLTHRTAGPRAVFHLCGRRNQSELRLLVAASTTLIGGPARVEVRRLGPETQPVSLGMIEVPWEDWGVQRLACPVKRDGLVTIELRTLTCVVPHHILHSGDHRELGVRLAAAHLC